MKCKIGISIAAVATFLFIAGYASAQMRLDTRARRSDPYYNRGASNMGHALDRNPLLGSGGRNASAGGTQYTKYTQNPSAFSDITRTPGLGAFHGNAPSIDPTFNSSSQNFGTARFDQQSVSVADVLRGGSDIYRPQDAAPFYSQGNTVMTVGQAERAAVLNVAPIPGNSNPTVDIARQNSMNQLTNEMNTQQYNQVGALLYLQDTPYAAKVASAAPGTLPAPDNAMQVLQLQQALDRSGYAQGMFGQTNPYDRIALTSEISQFDKEEQDADRQAGMIDARVDNGPISPENPIASINTNPISGKPPVREDFLYPQTEEAATDAPSRESTPLPTGSSVFDQDAFQELKLALQQKQMEERNAKEKKRKEEQEKTAAELDKALDKEAADAAEQEQLNDLSLKRDREQRQKMLVELNTKHDVVLKNLAGNSKDLFNRYMNNAKRALSKGRYYAASQQYELAAMSQTKNPLPWLGGCLAKFAACEWSVSGSRLQTAFEMYPSLMNVRLDFKTLLPEMDMQKQLNMLENWMIALDPQPHVILLASYMQYQGGNMAAARRHAESIMNYGQKVPPIIRNYAETILKKTKSEK